MIILMTLWWLMISRMLKLQCFMELTSRKLLQNQWRSQYYRHNREYSIEFYHSFRSLARLELRSMLWVLQLSWRSSNQDLRQGLFISKQLFPKTNCYLFKRSHILGTWRWGLLDVRMFSRFSINFCFIVYLPKLSSNLGYAGLISHSCSHSFSLICQGMLHNASCSTAYICKKLVKYFEWIYLDKLDENSLHLRWTTIILRAPSGCNFEQKQCNVYFKHLLKWSNTIKKFHFLPIFNHT